MHGFNSTARKNTQNYEFARKYMNINPKTDEIIQLYSDGLTSQSILGGAKYGLMPQIIHKWQVNLD